MNEWRNEEGVNRGAAGCNSEAARRARGTTSRRCPVAEAPVGGAALGTWPYITREKVAGFSASESAVSCQSEGRPVSFGNSWLRVIVIRAWLAAVPRWETPAGMIKRRKRYEIVPPVKPIVSSKQLSAVLSWTTQVNERPNNSTGSGLDHICFI